MTPEQFDAILAAVSAGESADAAIRAAGVTSGTFYRRIGADDEMAGRYARAKVAGCQKLADELVTIADEAPRLAVVMDEEGNERGMRVDQGAEAHRRTRIDTRKFVLAKLVPKVYGDKLDLNATVNVGDAVLERLARARGEKAAA